MKICSGEDFLVEYSSGHRFVDLDQELDKAEQAVRSSRDLHSCFTDEGDVTMRKLKKISKPEPETKAAGGYSAADLAKELGMKGSALRRALRAIKAKKPGKQWVWDKKSDPGLEKIRKELAKEGGSGKSKKKGKKA